MDCSAIPFNVRIENARLWNITNILHGNNTIIFPEFAFQVQLENNSDRNVLWQTPRGLLFEMSNMIQPTDDVMNKYMEMIRFMSNISKSKT